MTNHSFARMYKFRVYTGKPGTSLYLLVRIFATQREMLAKLNSEIHPAPRLPRRTRGAMGTDLEMSLINGRYRYSARIGTVNFCLPFLDMETVTHEFLHALFAWADRKRLRPQTKPRNGYTEDILCYAMGRFVRQFLQQVTTLGLSVSHKPGPVPRTLQGKLPWRIVRTDLTWMDELKAGPI